MSDFKAFIILLIYWAGAAGQFGQTWHETTALLNGEQFLASVFAGFFWPIFTPIRISIWLWS